MADPDATRAACAGVHGVFSVQNPMITGEEGEVAQGKNVVDAAAGAGCPSGLRLGRPRYTGHRCRGVGRQARGRRICPHPRPAPMAFMKLMTDKDLYPPVAAWHLMPRLVGEERPIPWLSVYDLGAIAARAFADPTSYVGSDLALAADLRSLFECRTIWRRVTGRSPRRFPMPVCLFERFVGPDLTRMWRWLATHEVNVDLADTGAHYPNVATVEEFARRRTRPPNR